MKIQVPLEFNDLIITKNNQFIAKNKIANNGNFFMVELPKPIGKWYIDGYYMSINYWEVSLIDKTTTIITCKGCGHLNAPNYTYCYECGFYLREKIIVQNTK